MLASIPRILVCLTALLWITATVAADAPAKAAAADCDQLDQTAAFDTQPWSRDKGQASPRPQDCANPHEVVQTPSTAASTPADLATSANTSQRHTPHLNSQQLAAIRIPIPLAPPYLQPTQPRQRPLHKSYPKQEQETNHSFFAAINKGHVSGHIDKIGNLYSFKNELEATLWSHADIKIESCLSSGCPNGTTSNKIIIPPLIHW